MFYPALARLSCADCLNHLPDYDFTKHRGSGKLRGPTDGEPWKRPKGSAPPCHKCPKRSPAEEQDHVLSNKNWQTYQLARRVRATYGRCLSDDAMQDPLLASNLALVNQLIDAYERGDLAERTALKLALMFPK